MGKLKEAKRNLDEAYEEFSRVQDKVTRLYEILLRQLIEEVTKNGLRLTEEQCREMHLSIYSGSYGIKCCDNRVLVACEYEYWSPFTEFYEEKTFLCVSCGKRFTRRKQVCPNCGKDVEPVQEWQEIR